MTDTRAISADSGFGLIEILVAMVFVGIVSIAVTTSLTTAMRTEKVTEVHFAASVLASDKMEQLTAIDSATLDSSFDETDMPVQWDGMEIDFLRTTTITINADDSRTIDVTVRSAHPLMPSQVGFSTTMALWE